MHESRQVEALELQKLASQWKCGIIMMILVINLLVYIETSAKLNQSVTKVFELMIQEIERTGDGANAGESQCTMF